MTGTARRLAPDLFDGERLALARLFRGQRKVDLAHAIGVTPGALTHYEQGLTRPKEAILAALALHLGFPPTFFERGRTLRIVSEAHVHFRSLRTTSKMDRDRLLARLSLLDEAVTEIEEMVELPPVVLPNLQVSSAAESAAESIASELRRRWGLGSGPLEHVVRLLELKGVIVLRPAVDTKEVDAFSTPMRGRPIVVLASDKQDAVRSRMDASHELGHLIMHQAAEPGRRSIERQAQRFASAFLLPAESMLAELPSQVRWDTYLSLKARWGVSVAALLYRAKTLGVISPYAYQRAQARLSAYGWRTGEPGDVGMPEVPTLLKRALALVAARCGVTLGDLSRRLRMYEGDVSNLLTDATAGMPLGPQLQVL